eukprot:6342083-Amphidinium_carterae.4
MQLDDWFCAWRDRGASVEYRTVALSKYTRTSVTPPTWQWHQVLRLVDKLLATCCLRVAPYTLSVFA